jgi:hypothetical protein
MHRASDGGVDSGNSWDRLQLQRAAPTLPPTPSVSTASQAMAATAPPAAPFGSHGLEEVDPAGPWLEALKRIGGPEEEDREMAEWREDFHAVGGVGDVFGVL